MATKTKTKKDPLLFHLYFVLLSVTIVGILLVTGIRLHRYFLNLSAPHSAREYYEQKRDFLQLYALDPKDKGYAYWVERDGSIKDSRKYSLFQANILLWAGGLQTQYPSDENLAVVKTAADYLVEHLYKGNGEWYEFDERNHRSKQEFFWNPRNESYIAYALMQAYRLTKNEDYLTIALETTAAQRHRFPTGQIFSDGDSSLDIGFRFPEHSAHLEEYALTGNEEALAWVELYDTFYRGKHGKEVLTPDGFSFYYHGMSVIDKLLYGFLQNDEEAYTEGSTGRDYYWSMAHDDDRFFNSLIPGESSDNGRDYYDKRLAMDLIEWTHRYDPIFQEDAQEMWFEIKRFWDTKEPGGFFVNTAQARKTCFTIGMPMMLIDVTAPEIVAYSDEQKGLWNHQTSITVRDPDYTWNNLTLRGIGMEPAVIKYRSPWGFRYGNALSVEGPCEGCVTYTVNSVALFSGKGKVYNEDKFANGAWQPIDIKASLAFHKWQDLNNNSKWYYIILLLGNIVTILVITALFLIFVRGRNRRKQL